MKKMLTVLFALALLSAPAQASCPCPNGGQDLIPPWTPGGTSRQAAPPAPKEAPDPGCPTCLACPSRLEKAVRASRRYLKRLTSRRTRHLAKCDKTKVEAEKTGKVKLARCLAGTQAQIKGLERKREACTKRKGSNCYDAYNKAVAPLQKEEQICRREKANCDDRASIEHTKCVGRAPSTPKKALMAAQRRFQRLKERWIRALEAKLKQARELSPP